jgi:hypothetical protein
MKSRQARLDLWALTVFLIFSAFAACKTTESSRVKSESMASTARAFTTENIAVILVHGWGHTPRWPEFIWKLRIRPYTSLAALREHFVATGFTNVNLVEYDDLSTVDEMASTVASQIQDIIKTSNSTDLKLDVVAHSLGQFVALKAILENKISPESDQKIADRVRIFVGLAGAARGQDIIQPCRLFNNQCGGAENLSPYYKTMGQAPVDIDKVFSPNFEKLNHLKKCSLYAQNDEIVNSPYNAGSFANLGLNPKNIVDLEIQYSGTHFHKDVKESPEILSKMMTSCYHMLSNH